MKSTNNLFAIATLIWGTTWIAITFQLGTVAVEASVTYRFLIAALLMFGWMKWRGETAWLPWSQQRWLLLMGALYCINYALIYRAEMTVSSGLVAVAGASLLFFNIVLSRLIFGTPLNRLIVIGALLGTFGIVLVFWPEVALFKGADAWRGAIYALLGSLGAAGANMCAMRLGREKLSVFTVNAWWMLWTALILAVVTVLSGQAFTFDWSAGYVLSLLYLAVFGSIIAFACYLTLIERIGASKASYIAVMTPVVAIIVSTFFEGFQWHPLTFVGMALIAGGQWLVLSKRS